MKLLVTGGAGFIGSHFVEYILSNTDHEVTTLDALTYAGSRSNLDGVIDHPRHRFVEGDIRSRELVNELMQGVSAVVNFAGESHVDNSVESAKPFASTNVVGTQTLLEAASDHGIERYVQVSTDEVYGEILDGKFKESDRLNPRNPYAATKAGGGILALSYYHSHGLPVCVTRSSNNFGPRQHEEKFIPKLITCTRDDETFPLYGDGSNVRDWIYVRDNCKAIETVLKNGIPGEVYNIGAGNEMTNAEMIDEILALIESTDDHISLVKDRPAHDQRYALDTRKIRGLGWETEYAFDEALEKTVESYLEES